MGQTFHRNLLAKIFLQSIEILYSRQSQAAMELYNISLPILGLVGGSIPYEQFCFAANGPLRLKCFSSGRQLGLMARYEIVSNACPLQVTSCFVRFTTKQGERNRSPEAVNIER